MTGILSLNGRMYTNKRREGNLSIISILSHVLQQVSLLISWLMALPQLLRAASHTTSNPNSCVIFVTRGFCVHGWRCGGIVLDEEVYRELERTFGTKFTGEWISMQQLKEIIFKIGRDSLLASCADMDKAPYYPHYFSLQTPTGEGSPTSAQLYPGFHYMGWHKPITTLTAVLEATLVTSRFFLPILWD